jgi:hypothetical protein
VASGEQRARRDRYGARGAAGQLGSGLERQVLALDAQNTVDRRSIANDLDGIRRRVCEEGSGVHADPSVDARDVTFFGAARPLGHAEATGSTGSRVACARASGPPASGCHAAEACADAARDRGASTRVGTGAGCALTADSRRRSVA